MEPSLVRKLVDATLLLVPILGALVASAAVRASGPVGPLVVPLKLGGSAFPGADYANAGWGITFPAPTSLVMVKITPPPKPSSGAEKR